MITLIWGAPATGKSALAPMVGAFLSDPWLRHFSTDARDLWVDRLIIAYARSTPKGDLAQRYSGLVNELRLERPRADVLLGLKMPERLGNPYIEASAFPGYFGSDGELRPELRAAALATAFRRIVTRESRVLVAGTGMNPRRFLPLLNSEPGSDFKVVVPCRTMSGYFPNSIELALERRSTPSARKNGKFVSAEIMRKVYHDQHRLLEAEGTWSRLRGRWKGGCLSRLIQDLSSTVLEQKIEDAIRLEFNRPATKPRIRSVAA